MNIQTSQKVNSNDVSIIIVTWNVCNFVRSCVSSILDTSHAIDYETIVIDNASSDGTQHMIRNEFPNIRLISNCENLGFARANNQGFQLAEGQYIFLLNPDTLLHHGALKKLIAFLDSNPQVGLAGPRLLNEDGTIQMECARRLPSLTSRLLFDALHLQRIPIIGFQLQKRLAYPYDYQQNQEVEAISGAAMLIRKELIQTLGGFDENFIHSGEDVDLCYRATQKGWRVYFVSEPAIVHLSGKSFSQATVRGSVNAAISKQLYHFRTSGLLMSIGYRLIVQCLQVPLMLFIGVLKAFLGYETIRSLQNRWEIARALWRWRMIKD